MKGPWNLVAALWSEVWQNRKRTSFNDLVKAYLPDIVTLGAVEWITVVVVRAWSSKLYLREMWLGCNVRQLLTPFAGIAASPTFTLYLPRLPVGHTNVSQSSTSLSNSMASRIGLRFSQFSSRATRISMRKSIGRRVQTTDAAAVPPAQGAFQRMWNSPVGVKTVHFWYHTSW